MATQVVALVTIVRAQLVGVVYGKIIIVEKPAKSFLNIQNAGLRNGREHWQWTAVDPIDGEEYFMLNIDFELFFDLMLDGNGKTVCQLDNNCVAKGTCGKDGVCPLSETYDQAATYAQVSHYLLQRATCMMHLWSLLALSTDEAPDGPLGKLEDDCILF